MIILLIAMLFIVSPSVFAEEILLDRSLPIYDEQVVFPIDDYYGSYGVRGSTLQGKGALSYCVIRNY